MRTRHDVARHIAAASALAVVLAGCSGGEPDQVEASQATPEPTIEAPSETAEPTETESEEPDPEPTIGEDEPLYAPLPDLEPDPDNDVPDDIEQLILDAYADAYNTEFTAYTSGKLDEVRLGRTHTLSAFDDVVYAVDQMAADGVVERSGDSSVDAVFIRDFAGGSAVVRECFTIGRTTGDYDVETGELKVLADPGSYARDWLIEVTTTRDDDSPRYRVVEAARSSERSGCPGA